MANMGIAKNLIDKLKAESKLMKLYKEFYSLTKPRRTDELLIKHYQDFEELVFNISKADGNITIDELLKKSTYDFYSYKRMLKKYLGRKNKKNTE